MNYWLIELRTGGNPACYYTSPNHWGSNVDLATKFHTKMAAELEMAWVKVAGSSYELVVADHLWV